MDKDPSGLAPESAHSGEEGYVILGRITGLYGVRGWVKVHSETEPRQNILTYRPWLVRMRGDWVPCQVAEGRAQGKGIVVKLVGFDDRDRAVDLLQCDIAVERSRLPKPRPGEYYWTDLEGLRVETVTGIDLGHIDHLFGTGANDVMVVQGERERLIPFIRGQVVHEVDLAARRMRVDWDPEF